MLGPVGGDHRTVTATRTVSAAKAGPLGVRERRIRFDGRHVWLLDGRSFGSLSEHLLFRSGRPAPMQSELVFAIHAVVAKQSGESEPDGGHEQGGAGSRERTSFLKQ